METTDIVEKAHQTNIARLLEEFGADREEEIHYLYRNARETDEKNAKINEFVPIFIYRAVRDALRANYC